MSEAVSGLKKKDGQSPHPDALAYTLADARRMGGPSRSQIYKLNGRGVLKLIRVGRRTYVEGASLRRLMSSGEK